VSKFHQATIEDSVRIEVPGTRAATLSCAMMLDLHDVLNDVFQDGNELKIFRVGVCKWRAVACNGALVGKGPTPLLAIACMRERFEENRAINT